MVHPMLLLLSTPEDVMAASATYLNIYFAGISGLLIYNMGSGILRAVGDTRRPLLFLILVLLSKTDDVYHLSWNDLRCNLPILKQIISIGLPTGIQAVITSFSNIFVQSYINYFGSTVMAGWSIYNKLDQFIMLPMQSISQAATTFVSQNIGAQKEDRVNKGTVQSLFLILSITAIIVTILFLFASEVTGIFTKDSAVIQAGTVFLRTNIFFLLFNCINHTLAGALRGRGDSTGPMIIMLMNFVVLRQIYLFIMTHFIRNTVQLVGFGYPVGWTMCCITEVTYFYIRWVRPRKSSI